MYEERSERITQLIKTVEFLLLFANVSYLKLLISVLYKMVLDSIIMRKPSSFKLFLEVEEYLDFLELNAHKPIPVDCPTAYSDLCAAQLGSRQLQAISSSWQCR